MRKIDLNNFQVATNVTVRDINSRIMLNLVRKHQPVTRADLMRQSGLQRSTVSAITGQLISERWLREGAVSRLPRGRRPTFLHLNEDRAGIFGVNVQPLTTDIALANLGGHFLAQESLPTPASSTELVKQVGKCICTMMKAHSLDNYDGIGVSLPGRVDLTTQKFVFAPNLKWEDIDIKAELEHITGLSVDLENAANACALAEFWFGKHNETVRNLIVVTVSEGIGVGLILNGQLVRGTSGLAGEFGHIIIDDNGPRCGCGNYGCWEVYASNSAAIRYYTEKWSSNNKKNFQKQQVAKTFANILRLAEQGDAKALDALNCMAHYLGKGISMLVTGLAPEVIVVVGDIVRFWDKISPIVTNAVKQYQYKHATTKIMVSESTTQPRLRGIVALVLQKRFGAP